ncbi:hypothetical protein SUGI_0071320 [Cryptomeria japonica]|nr:hypothetical protein SUGI_0071320 [Cryptomeria japonica]
MCEGLTDIRIGCFYHNGDWLNVAEFTLPLRPFLLWRALCDKEERQVEAKVGWNSIKEYLCDKEREVTEKGPEAEKHIKKRLKFKKEDYWMSKPSQT